MGVGDILQLVGLFIAVCSSTVIASVYLGWVVGFSLGALCLAGVFFYVGLELERSGGE